jgi:serine/threonine protein kinase
MDYTGKIIDKYTIERVIGKGGMGSVFLGTDNAKTPASYVAIKALSSKFSRDEDFRKRFRREAELHSRFSHPNLISLEKYLETENDCFLIMEYFKSKSLSAKIGKEIGPVPYLRAIPIFIQILKGLDHLHQQNTVHRDLKPSNILINEKDEIKIIDFGIAKSIEEETDGSITRTGVIVGTPYYMAPEQIKGFPATIQSDIYSLGITFYETLAGRHPFDYQNDFDIRNAQVNEIPKPPTEHYPHIPQEIVDFVMKAIEKNPAERFQDCTEMILELDNIFNVQIRLNKENLLPEENIKVKIANKSNDSLDSNKNNENRDNEKKSKQAEKRRSKVWKFAIGVILFLVIFIVTQIQNRRQLSPQPVPIYSSTPTAIDYYTRALSKYNNGDYGAAVMDFSTHIKHNNTHWDSYYYRGLSHYHLNNYNSALHDANAVVNNRNRTKDYKLRGQINYKLEKYKEAIDDLSVVLSNTAHDYEALFLRGSSYYFSEDLVNGMKDVQELLKRRTNDDDYELAAFISYGLEDYEKAINYFSTLIDHGYNSAASFQMRGLSYYFKNQIAAALNDISQSIILNSNDGYSYFARGYIFVVEYGDKYNGCQDLQKAIQLGYEKAQDVIDEHCK